MRNMRMFFVCLHSFEMSLVYQRGPVIHLNIS